MHTFKTLKHLAYSISLCVLLVGCYKMGGKDEQKTPPRTAKKTPPTAPLLAPTASEQTALPSIFMSMVRLQAAAMAALLPKPSKRFPRR